MNLSITARGLALLLVGLGLLGVFPVASAQPAEPERIYTTPNFAITWVDDPSDPNAPDLRDADGSGVPDAVERVADAFEAARAFLLTDLGYLAPPVDGGYQLYVGDLGGRGYTQEAPGGSGRSKPSFIVVPPQFVQVSESDAVMRTFAVHEYFHAIQIGYDSAEDHWITEASSTWVEDVFVDSLDDSHFYLRDFLPYPRMSLFSSNGRHEYGAFLFVQFLVERFNGGDPTIVRELWERMAVPEAIPGATDDGSREAIVAVLAARGVTLDAAWGEFLLWQRRLSHFEEGVGYRSAMRGTEWPALLRSTRVRTESCRLDTDAASGGLPPLSGDYAAVRTHRKGPAEVRATLTARGPAGAAGFYVVKPKGKPATEHLMTFDATGIARAEVPFGRKSIRRMTLGLGNGAPSGDEATIAYSLRLPGRNRIAISGPAGAGVVPYGLAVFVSGGVTCRGAPALFADVLVTETEVASGATRTFITQTDQFGRWDVLITPEDNARYTAEVVDPLLSGAATKDALRTDVRVVVTMTLDRHEVPEGTPVLVSGEVEPAHSGVPVVIEYRRPERNWQTGPETTTDAASRFSASLVLPGPGIWEVRARVTSTNDNDHVPGMSVTELVEVEGL
jgi:hypothetical protein